jgi:hypothetical protein
MADREATQRAILPLPWPWVALLRPLKQLGVLDMAEDKIADAFCIHNFSYVSHSSLKVATYNLVFSAIRNSR